MKSEIKKGLHVLLLLALFIGVTEVSAEGNTYFQRSSKIQEMRDSMEASDPIKYTCSAADAFVFDDQGVVLTKSDVLQFIESSGIDADPNSRDYSAADPGAVVLADGSVRMYILAGMGGILALGSDDGISNWRILSQVVNPLGEFSQHYRGNALGQPRAVMIETGESAGEIRLFVSTSEEGFISLTSNDGGVGLSFEFDEGVRISKSEAGAASREYIVKLSHMKNADETYRAFYSVEQQSTRPEDNEEFIKSAITGNLKDYFVQAGIVLGAGSGGDGDVGTPAREPWPVSRSGGVTLFFAQEDGSMSSTVPTAVRYSTSEDGGASFSGVATLMKTDGTDVRGAGPNIVQLKDGTYLFYHDAGNNDDPNGFHIRVGKLTLQIPQDQISAFDEVF